MKNAYLFLLIPFLFACTPTENSDRAAAASDPAPDSSPKVPQKAPAPNLTQLRADSKFKEHGAPYVGQDDDGVTVVGFMATITDTQYSAELHDFLDLSRAASREFVEPSLGNCQLSTSSIDVIGPADEILNFSTHENEGSRACEQYLRLVADQGLVMRFTDVPLLNGHGQKIPQVTLRISNR